MRYSKGKFIVTGNPSLAWIDKMTKYGLIFTYKGGQVIAEVEKISNEGVKFI